MSDVDKKTYLSWLSNQGGFDSALAATPGGCWAATYDRSPNSVKLKVFRKCQLHCNSDACEIKDINGTSDFIQQLSTSNTLPRQEFGISRCDMVAGGLCTSEKPVRTAQTSQNISLDLTTSDHSSTPSNNSYTVQNGSAEIVFWQSIQDSDDPEMYRAYIDKFPSGVYVSIAKIKFKQLRGDVATVDKSSIPNLEYGRYHALVIGNNRYDNFRDLRTAIYDAQTVSRLLEMEYGFNVKLLENATRSEILGSINKLRYELDRYDNVLIYYAGHGHLDPDTDEGFWIPVDADHDDESNWLLTDRVRSKIKAMPAKHVLVVADSCFSGRFTRSAITRGLKIEESSSEYLPILQRLIEKKSRTVLTSGGLEPVLDSGSGDHSVFAEAFISILRVNDGVLDAAGLFTQLRPKVINNSSQTPEYNIIHGGGHDGGDFLFVRQ